MDSELMTFSDGLKKTLYKTSSPEDFSGTSPTVTKHYKLKEYASKLIDKITEYGRKTGRILAREGKLWVYDLPRTLIRENLGISEEVPTKDGIKNYIKEHKFEFVGEIIGTAIIGTVLDRLAWGKYGWHTEGVSMGPGEGSCTIYLNPLLYPFSYLFGSGSLTTTTGFGELWEYKEFNRLLHKPYYYVLGALFSFTPRIGYEIYKRLRGWRKKE
jgi:hypothetical protein